MSDFWNEANRHCRAGFTNTMPAWLADHDEAFSFGDHYRAANDILLSAVQGGDMDTESLGETLSYAYAEALRSRDAAGSSIETELAKALVTHIWQVAKTQFGIRIRKG